MRQTPAAVEFEKHVLGACFLEPEAMSLACNRLRDDDFWLERHSAIWLVLKAAFAQANTLDILGLKNALEVSGKLQQAGGEEYLREIDAEVCTAANVEKHIQTLKEYGQRRRLIRSLGASLDIAYDLSKP